VTFPLQGASNDSEVVEKAISISLISVAVSSESLETTNATMQRRDIKHFFGFSTALICMNLNVILCFNSFSVLV